MMTSRDANRAFWEKQVGGDLPLTGFPLDRPRPPVESYLRATEMVTLDADESTSYAAVLAALGVLLHRYSMQDNVVVGGVRSDVVLYRIDFGDDPSFEEVLKQTGTLVEDSEAHAEGAYESIRAITGEQGRDPDLPLFRTMLLTEDMPDSCDAADECAARCDIVFRVRADEQGCEMEAGYDAELFEQKTIARLLNQLGHLLLSARGNMSKAVSVVPLKEPGETELKPQSPSFPPSSCMHERFEEQAAKTPDRVAVSESGAAGRSVTYAELDARANQLGHHLQKAGVEPDMLVGLYVERSLDLVVAILGILKAGGAYLPMDLAYPPERMAFMLEDARTKVIVAQESLREKLPSTDARVVSLDGDADEISGESRQKPESGVTPGHLVYSIFTSGSTGKPKGALIEHRNVSRLFDATEPWFRFDENDVWTLFHSCAFDFSVWEMWGALLYVGRLVVVPYLTSRSPEDFYHLLVEEGVTVLNQTPSAFRQLLPVDERRGATKLDALRLIIFGGEALELQSLAPWFRKYGDAKPQLVNMYGITETTVHVTYRPLKESDLTEAPGSVIGKPIPDLQIYVLDPERHPLPIGVPGEVYVGGGGVTRGYLNREKLTAERFIENPFERGSNTRLYRTGDLARRLPNDDLQYLGRVDHQVKLRGFRIELGEIESVIGQHPAVRENLVVSLEEDGDVLLVAYVVPKESGASLSHELLTRLRARLPDYMVPTAFVVLDVLPLTPHGKVDRAALPPPEAHRPELETGYVAPGNEVERAIVAIYKEILHVDNVGIDDNFFELGGDSLRVGRVLGRLREELSVDLEMVKLFEYPTVRTLAEYLAPGEKADTSMERAHARASRKRDAAVRRRQLVKDRSL